MVWSKFAQQQHKHVFGRFETDLENEEWAYAESIFWPLSGKRCPRSTDLRAVFGALQQMLGSVCHCRAVPQCFLQFVVLHRWSRNGTDGRKRHSGLGVEMSRLRIVVCEASIQVRHGAETVIQGMHRLASNVTILRANCDCQKPALAEALAKLKLGTTLVIVKQPKGNRWFGFLLSHQVVERTLARMSLLRQQWRDGDSSPNNSLAWIHRSACSIMNQQLAQGRAIGPIPADRRVARKTQHLPKIELRFPEHPLRLGSEVVHRVRRFVASLMVLASVLMLLGCGGGGTGEEEVEAPTPEIVEENQPPVTTPPPTTPRLSIRDRTSGQPVIPAGQCVQVYGGDCLTRAEYVQSVQSKKTSYKNHVNFISQRGLDFVDAEHAYANLELLKGPSAKPGEGVTIGFLDTGIDQNHALFSGRTVDEVFLGSAVDEDGSVSSHGTAVAGVAAASQSGVANQPQGVAWGSDIAMFAIRVGTGSGNYVPITVHQLTTYDSTLANHLNTIFQWRSGTRQVDFLNIGVGFEGLVSLYSKEQIETGLSNFIAALRQTGSSEKVIAVFAGGNANNDTCDAPGKSWCVNGEVDASSVGLLAGLPYHITDLKDQVIAVVAIEGDQGRIAEFSNYCGVAKDFCIAAPGVDIHTAYFGPESDTTAQVSGTSMAAPMVTGGLALMKQLFRDQLSNTELAKRLLDTADRSGIYANANIYGRGLMNLGAATSPVGSLIVPITMRERVSKVNFGSTQLLTGHAFGDGLEDSVADSEVAAFDSLGAPFWYQMEDLTTTESSVSPTQHLKLFMSPDTIGGQSLGFHSASGPGPLSGADGGPRNAQLVFLGSPRMPETSHASIVDGGVAVLLFDQGAVAATAYTTEGISGRPPASGVEVSLNPPGSAVQVKAGWIEERNGILGSASSGAFGALESSTAFLGMQAGTEISDWKMQAKAELGTTQPYARGGIIAGVSPVTTTALSFSARRELDDDGSLQFSIAQPLRIESGTAELQFPVGRKKDGTVIEDSLLANLEPTGRQLELAARFARPVADGELRLGASWTHRPGHSRDANSALKILSGWVRTF